MFAIFLLLILALPDPAQGDAGISLDFDATRCTMQAAPCNGRTVFFRAYEGLVYVARPVDAQYQQMNIYVPAEYFEGKAVHGFTADTAPIFLPNTVGGYMPGVPDRPGPGRDGAPNAALTALSRGYVVAAPGVRGRTLQDETGRYTGKAPAAIIDLKAAVRYLRRNDGRMPGNAERIISNGTSAGGALSALLGATGNSPDYLPWLHELGAADARDDILAASCYCPITDLDHADMAYEWQFAGIAAYRNMTIRMVDGRIERQEIAGNLTAGDMDVSTRLALLFPGYVNSLDLTGTDGTPLTLTDDGAGPFRVRIATLLMASAQKALDSGQTLSDQTWLIVTDGKVTGLDFAAYARAIGRMKTPPAFDAMDLGTGENSLFGTATVDTRHFTAHAPASAPQADPHLVTMMNPLGYISAQQVNTARFWRIRQGTRDRDTSLAVPTILATTLINRGYAVDFALPWDKSHSGDYDLDELFAWADGICK